MRRPSLALVVAVNRAVRAQDEWFEEPDDLDRVRRALSTIDTLDDPVEAAAVLAYRITRTQGFRDPGDKPMAQPARQPPVGLDGQAGFHSFARCGQPADHGRGVQLIAP